MFKLKFSMYLSIGKNNLGLMDKTMDIYHIDHKQEF